MSVQTTYSNQPAGGRVGLRSTARRDDVMLSRTASGAVKVGVLGLFGPHLSKPGDLSPGQFAAMGALAVSVNAIVTTTASSASAAVLSGAGLTGATGAAIMSPARRITFIANSNANWDLTTIIVEGLDAAGNPISEALVMPDAGGVTLTTNHFFSYVTAIRIPAQSGTGGSYTVGVTADEGIFTPGSVGIVLRDLSREPLDSSDQYADQDSLEILTRGAMWVAPETDVVAGTQAWVRTVVSGGNVRGQFAAPLTAGCSPLPNAFWASSGTAAAALAEIELR